MNLLWQNAALAGFAALLAVPLLVHLLARARPPVRRFPSLYWIRPAVKKSLRLRRPADWLLLVLRTLVIGLIVAAFLQPLWVGKRSADNSQEKTVVVLMDRTASMGWVEDGQSRWARGVAAASDVLANAGSGARTNVVWLDAVPDAVLPEPGSAPAFLTDQLRRSTVAPEAANLPAALTLAVEQLQQSGGARELIVVSDFQEAGWKNADLSVPPSIALTKIPVASSAGANLAVTRLTVDPPQPIAGTEVRIECEVRNYSAEARRTTLYLESGESRRSLVVELAPWGQALPVFRLTFPKSGPVPLRAAIDEDAFPVDDARDGILQVREALNLTIVAGPDASGSTEVWQRAAAALGWVAVEVREDLPGASGTLPEVLLAVRTPTEQAAALTELAGRGAAVMIEPGPGWQGGVEETQTATQPGWRLAVQDPDAAMLKMFAGGESGDPAAGEFRRRLRLPGAAEGKVLFNWADGPPSVILQNVGKGRVLFWGATPDPAWSTHAQQAAFLPLLAETWLQLAPAPLTSRQVVTAGEFPVWTPGPSAAGGEVTLTNPAGVIQAVRRLEGNGVTWASLAPLPPGAWQWRVGGEVVEPAAIVFPAVESDLRPSPPDTAAGLADGTAEAAAARFREGWPVWPVALAAALLLLLIEGWVAHRAALPAPLSA